MTNSSKLKVIHFHIPNSITYSVRRLNNSSIEIHQSQDGKLPPVSGATNIINENHNCNNKISSTNLSKGLGLRLSLGKNKNENAENACSASSRNLTKTVYKPRYNRFGIQMIDEHLYSQLFKDKKLVDISEPREGNEDKIEQCLLELKRNNLVTKQAPFKEIKLQLPKLKGNTLEEHFFNIGKEQSQPYKNLMESLIEVQLEMPKEWVFQSGWTRYSEGKAERVEYPRENALVFDVEVCCKESDMPVMATAVSPLAWYGWVSEDLIKGSSKYQDVRNKFYSVDDLIPLESGPKTKGNEVSGALLKPRIVVGHNVSYDRARVKEQYWLRKTGLRFIDTLSIHVSISGVTSYQKDFRMAGLSEQDWFKHTSFNSSLEKVYELYCGSKISKTERDMFVTGSLLDIKDNFQSLMKYCATDVMATQAVFSKIFPIFLSRFPHPVTLAGMLELQTAYIPVNDSWNRYLSESEQAYEDLGLEIKSLLKRSVNDACRLMHEDNYKKDFWLWDQDWSSKKLSFQKVQPKKKKNFSMNGDCHSEIDLENDTNRSEIDSRFIQLGVKLNTVLNLKEYLPAKSQLLPGYPSWYRQLCLKPDTADWVPGPVLISTGMRITPKLLKLMWKNMPLHFVKDNGWGFLVPYQTDIEVDSKDYFPIKDFMDECRKHCSYVEPTIGFEKLPHKDGLHLNVGNPLSKYFMPKYVGKELIGCHIIAPRVMEISRMLSYWRNNRERIGKQMVCWLNKKDLQKDVISNRPIGAILPLIVVCGTLTRRAVERTWMTVSNAITDRIGSELRGIVQAPEGYSFVGADVDSQELWIASLLGDAHFARMHGATPLGWMTINGHKSDGTDMHSVTAAAVGISRNHAKVLNYARIYGAGQRYSERLLRDFNPGMDEKTANTKITKMFKMTKGSKMYKLKDDILPHIKKRDYPKWAANNFSEQYSKNVDELFDTYWTGGTESAMFNSLENIAQDQTPTTPFLKCQISRALEPGINKEIDNQFMPTRINWVVQSGAVDFLHLMLVSMKSLLGPDSRFCLSFHDEVRYLVPDSKKYNAALALHITNLLTRAFFVSRLKMTDLPQSVAFFSSVEIDKVLRKESNDDNKTPSNPYGLSRGYGIPNGESLSIYDTMDKTKESL